MKHKTHINRVICILTYLTVLTFSSCATFYAQQSNLPEQINVWRGEHNFEIALETIAKLKPDHPDYQSLSALVPKIEQERSRYIKEVLIQADNFSHTQDWVGATETVDQALEHLPSSPELIDQRRYYNDKRLERVERDKAAILIAQAKYIITARPYQESLLYNANSKFFAYNTYNSFTSTAKQASRELYALGKRYWQDDKIVQAREALTLSIQTATNSLSEELLAQVLEREQQERAVARNNALRKADDQWPELVQSYNNRIESQDFVGAERILKEMNVLGFADSDLYLQRFEQLKLERVKALTLRGNKLYNSGLIAEAIESWEQAQKLAPNNSTITQNLERARTFLGNLERWSDKDVQ